MKVLLITKDQPIVEIKKLATELAARNHEVIISSPSLSIDSLSSDEFWGDYTDVDVVYYRTGFGDAARMVLYQKLKEKNIKMVNEPWLQNVLISNKAHQAIVAKIENITIPNTLIGRNHSFSVIEERLGCPFILKAAHGIQGNKVFLINSESEYLSELEKIEGDVLIQEYIQNDGDYRVFVVNGSVLAIFKRVPKSGDFRANIAQGGTGEEVPRGELYDQLSDFALRMSKAIKLDIVGMDIMVSQKTGELVFIEANVNPGWKGLEEALGVSITGQIADYIGGAN
jgi:RimK family alpha-L-glutamate ligase